MATARFGRLGTGYAPGGNQVSFYFDPKVEGIIRLTDKVTGLFLGGAFQQALSYVHAGAAEHVAQSMVEHLEQKMEITKARIARPDTGKYLRRALIDERNRDSTASTFLVGRPSFLDESYAQYYWRRIEEGGPGFRTNALFGGAFPRRSGDKLVGPYRPGGGARQTPPKGYPHARMPQGVGPMIQVRAQEAYRYMRDGGRRGAETADMYQRYDRALAAIGIDISRVAIQKGK